ncbi:MAG: N-acetylmuramoyl-L-alanine amidase [bacterium]
MNKSSKILILLSSLLLFGTPAKAYQDCRVEKVRFDSYLTYTRVVLEVSGKVGYIVRDLTNPPRLLINLYPAKPISLPPKIDIKDRFIRQLRLSQDSEHVTKVVLDLRNLDYTYNIFPLEGPHRLVIEVKNPRKDPVADLLKPREFSYYSPESVSEENRRVYKVILDPGHGGEDPGAIGPTGLKEKKVTLAVALEVADLLKDEAGIYVYLTRTDDRFIPLDRRTEMANQWGGDLFVSIHANAAFNQRASGIETFFNSRYPYGEGAAEVAARENAPLGDDDVSGEAKAILWDLVQDRYRDESNELSHFVQRGLCQATSLEDRGVKSAGFYVLRGAAMPAILVEIGFVSNPWEEQKLKKEEFRKEIALGIFGGIKDYLESYSQRLSR